MTKEQIEEAAKKYVNEFYSLNPGISKKERELIDAKGHFIAGLYTNLSNESKPLDVEGLLKKYEETDFYRYGKNFKLVDWDKIFNFFICELPKLKQQPAKERHFELKQI
jgi:hypothetical protein